MWLYFFFGETFFSLRVQINMSVRGKKSSDRNYYLVFKSLKFRVFTKPIYIVLYGEQKFAKNIYVGSGYQFLLNDHFSRIHRNCKKFTKITKMKPRRKTQKILSVSFFSRPIKEIRRTSVSAVINFKTARRLDRVTKCFTTSVRIPNISYNFLVS